MGGKSIPSEWLNYKPIGTRISGTRFIAFKVPLREHILEKVTPDNRMTVDKLICSAPDVKLVIDLTCTSRYYNPNDIKKHNIQYRKLEIPGVVMPSERLVEEFFEIVEEFIKENDDNDNLIGVHCTHGVNRTGYLVCRYMIEYLQLPAKEAIRRFTVARGHNIKRANYINKLMFYGTPYDTNIYSKGTHVRGVQNRTDYSLAMNIDGKILHEDFYLPRRSKQNEKLNAKKPPPTVAEKATHNALVNEKELSNADSENEVDEPTSKRRGKLNPLTNDVFLPNGFNDEVKSRAEQLQKANSAWKANPMENTCLTMINEQPFMSEFNESTDNTKANRCGKMNLPFPSSLLPSPALPLSPKLWPSTGLSTSATPTRSRDLELSAGLQRGHNWRSSSSSQESSGQQRSLGWRSSPVLRRSTDLEPSAGLQRRHNWRSSPSLQGSSGWQRSLGWRLCPDLEPSASSQGSSGLLVSSCLLPTPVVQPSPDLKPSASLQGSSGWLVSSCLLPTPGKSPYAGFAAKQGLPASRGWPSFPGWQSSPALRVSSGLLPTPGKSPSAGFSANQGLPASAGWPSSRGLPPPSKLLATPNMSPTGGLLRTPDLPYCADSLPGLSSTPGLVPTRSRPNATGLLPIPQFFSSRGIPSGSRFVPAAGSSTFPDLQNFPRRFSDTRNNISGSREVRKNNVYDRPSNAERDYTRQNATGAHSSHTFNGARPNAPLMHGYGNRSHRNDGSHLNGKKVKMSRNSNASAFIVGARICEKHKSIDTIDYEQKMCQYSGRPQYNSNAPHSIIDWVNYTKLNRKASKASQHKQ